MAGEQASRTVEARGVKCASCGAPFTLRGFARTVCVACEYCGNVFDTSTPEWQLISRVEKARQEAPLWPLGTKAKFEGGKRFDLVGWVKRFVEVGGERYFWEEHLFFSPFHGYRYLVYQNGHFSYVTPLPGVGQETPGSTRRATYLGETYRHFQQGQAVVYAVIGEFPWLVKRGETVLSVDYVAPPLMLSEERTAEESVWSSGVYWTQDQVIAAVGPPKRPFRYPQGVAPNQPNPVSAAPWIAKATGYALLAWCLLSCVYVFRCSAQRVKDISVPPKSAMPKEVAHVGTETLESPPGLIVPITLESSRSTANVEIAVHAPVDNNWAAVSCALVDTKNEHAYPFGVEVEYYRGYEDGEHWSEGSQNATVVIGGIPNGEYVLQIERDDTFQGPVNVVVRRDVALARYPIVALILILLFPAILLLRSRSFEARRWAESDHPTGG